MTEDPLNIENTAAYERWVQQYGLPQDYTDWEEVSCGAQTEIRARLTDLIDRLKTRAEIRRSIKTRKSVQEGKADRLADLLDEAAFWLEALRKKSLLL